MKYSPSTRLPMSRPCMSVKATITVSRSPFLTAAVSSSLVSKPSPCGFLVAATSPRNKALEKRPRPGQVGGEVLWRALDSNDKPVVRLDAFDCAVLAGCGLLEPVSQVLDRLVVQAVDPNLVLAGRPSQLRRRIYLDRVREVTAPERAHLVALQVLTQRAAHGDVDHLLAAADAEHRECALPRLAKKRQLGLIQLRVGLADLFVSPLSVKGRIDVPAAWKEQPVEVRERLGPRQQVHGLGARGHDRPAVGPEILQAPPRVDRDPDLGTLVTRRPPQARPRSSRPPQLTPAPLDL